jgi:hypothetical protein
MRDSQEGVARDGKLLKWFGGNCKLRLSLPKDYRTPKDHIT